MNRAAAERQIAAIERDPSSLAVHQVCPSCKRPVVTVRVRCDGHMTPAYHCPEHGGIATAINSHVVNR